MTADRLINLQYLRVSIIILGATSDNFRYFQVWTVNNRKNSMKISGPSNAILLGYPHAHRFPAFLRLCPPRSRTALVRYFSVPPYPSSMLPGTKDTHTTTFLFNFLKSSTYENHLPTPPPRRTLYCTTSPSTPPFCTPIFSSQHPLSFALLSQLCPCPVHAS